MPFGLLEWRKMSPVQMSAAILMRICHESGFVWCLHCRQSSRLPFGMNSKTNTLASLHTPIRVTRFGCLILHSVSTCNMLGNQIFRCPFLFFSYENTC
jgi:hypothetical protein